MQLTGITIGNEATWAEEWNGGENDQAWGLDRERKNGQKDQLGRPRVTGVNNRAVTDTMTSSNLTPSFMVNPTETVKSNESKYLQPSCTLKIERSFHSFIQYTSLEHLSCVKNYAICADSNVQRTIKDMEQKHSSSKCSPQILH